MGRAEFVRADIRNPLIAKVISQASVDTVVHASLAANPAPRRAHGDEGDERHRHDAAARRLPEGAERAAVRAEVDHRRLRLQLARPGPLRRGDDAEGLPAGGYAKDAVEIEGYLRGFARRRPDVSVTVLRVANIIGPRIDTVFTRYFALPVVPTVLGYDARVQLLHEEDALAVLERAASLELPGTFNVAADGVLMLSQAIRRAGRIAIPVPGPAVGPVSRIVRGARLVDFSPEQMRLLNFGRVVDTTRLRTQFGFTPRWTTLQAFDDYVRGRALRP
jgi:UDP-glucose 4-epimerase